MIVGKREMKKSKIFGKLPAVVVAIIVVLVFSAGATLAFLAASTEQLKNQFTPAEVHCEVNDDYSIKNTSDIEVYIRATTITNFVNGHNNICGEKHDKAPTVEFTDDTKWVHASDGYWYYTERVAVLADTSILVTTYTPVTASDGCKSQLVVLCSAIQADPFTSYQNAWETVAGVNFG